MTDTLLVLFYNNTNVEIRDEGKMKNNIKNPIMFISKLKIQQKY